MGLGGGFCGLLGRCFDIDGEVAFEFFEHELGGAFGLVGVFGFVEFGLGGEGAEGGVVVDLVDGLAGLGLGLVFGQVEAGDLETVEQEAGAAGVDFVEGDALQDFADGVLDGGAVFGVGEGEGLPAAAALLEVLHRFSGGVVVVAEIFAAEAGAGAAAAVGEDVAAAEAGGFGVAHLVVSLPGVLLVQSLRNMAVRSGLLVRRGG